MPAKRRTTSAALTIAIVSIPIFIGALDLTVVSAVLPEVLLDLEVPISDFDIAAWIVTGYLLAYTVSMTFMGRLSDLYGRKRIFLVALVIFALGSYLVAVSDAWPTRVALRSYFLLIGGRIDPSRISLGVMIGSRVIQAFGAGAMVPVGMALVGDLFPPDKRARSLGVIAAVDTAGWVVGHLYGGIIVRYWTWQTIFWLNLPISAIAFVVILYVLHEKDQPQSEGKMDWIGAGLITLSLTAFIFGLGSTSDPNSTSSLNVQTGLPPYTLQLILLSIFFLGLFIWRQTRIKHPLIELSLFRRPNLSLAIAANFLVGFSLFIAIANVPLFINILIAVTPEQGAWESGWVLSALTVPMALAAVPGGWLTERTSYRLPAISGLVAAIVAFSTMTSWQQSTAYSTMVPQLAIAGIGFGFTMAPIAAAVVNASPEGYRGTGSALVIIFRLLGMTAGVSSITTYGLNRAEVLVSELLPPGANLVELGRVGFEAWEKVISETFVIAGAACAMAIIPIFFLKSGTQNEEGRYDRPIR